MGFLDKVKTQATALAEKAQDGARAGQEKLSGMQAKRQADALLLELGGLTYLARAGRAAPDGDAQVARLMDQLAAHEAEHGPVSVSPPVAPPGETGSYVPAGGAAAGGGAPAAPSPTLPGVPGDPVGAPGPAFTSGVPQAVTDAVPGTAQGAASPDLSSPAEPTASNLPVGSYTPAEETHEP